MRKILQNKDVKEWYENTARGRISTAETWLRTLNRVCQYMDRTPKQLSSMSKSALENAIKSYISTRERSKPQSTRSSNATVQGSTIANELKVLKSFLSWCGTDTRSLKKFKIKDANITVVSTTEKVPSQDELRQVLNSAGPRERAIISLMAFTGIRPEVIGSFKADDGLRIQDIHGLELHSDHIEFKELPATIVIRPEISKTKRSYVTFVGPEGIASLKSYLESRLNSGEKLHYDSPVIATLTSGGFLFSNKIGELARSVMRKAGLNQRPYIWRSYFATRGALAEKSGLSRDNLRYMMGHTGSMLDKYTLQKVLSEDTLNDLRNGYNAALTYMETSFNRESVNSLWDKIFNEISTEVYELEPSKVIGQPREAVYQEIRNKMRSQGNDLVKLIADTLGIEVSDEKLKTIEKPEFRDMVLSAVNGIQEKQKIIEPAELEDYVTRGAQFVSQLNDGRIVVKFKTIADRLT